MYRINFKEYINYDLQFSIALNDNAVKVKKVN